MRKVPPDPEVQYVNPHSHDSRLHRRFLLGAIGIVTVITMAVTVILMHKALTSPASTSDRLAAVGDVLVGATLLLAAIAALVALLAYSVSTGRPNIRLSLEQSGRRPNNPKFEAGTKPGGIMAFEIARLKVLLRNESVYSAKNPALVIRLQAMAFEPEMHSGFY